MIRTRVVGRMPAGTLDEGVEVDGATLSSTGLEVELLGLGAAIAGVRAPDRSGATGPVHLALDGLDGYAERSLNPHLGASIGRYANRIAGARFELGGRSHVLDANNGPNTLHGGSDGWDRRVWSLVDATDDPDGGTVVFGHHSPDGDSGFPGAADATAEFSLDGDRLRITYEVTTDSPTVVSMTNHGYWNLAGSGTVLDHRLRVHADEVLPVGPDGIPTGAPVPVEGSVFDLRDPTGLGGVIESMPGGLDHCYVVRGDPGVQRRCAVLECPSTGRWMRLSTDQPGVQVYTGNNLHPPFAVHGAVSLETQALPDSPNHPEYGSVVLEPEETYRAVSEYTFGTGPAPD